MFQLLFCVFVRPLSRFWCRLRGEGGQTPHNSYDEIALEPALAESFFASIRSTIEDLEQQDLPAVLVVSPILRPWLARLLRRSTKDLTVLCYTEIPDDQPINVVSSIEVNEREEEQP